MARAVPEGLVGYNALKTVFQAANTKIVQDRPLISSFTWPTSFSGDGSGSNPWVANVTISGVTTSSRVDIQPSPAQVAVLQDKGTTSCVISTDTSSGATKLYLLGEKTVASDFGSNTSFQVTVTTCRQ